MGDEVRVTVIAAGFERWEEGRPASGDRAPSMFSGPSETVDIFADATSAHDEFDLGDDDFDVPSFLR
jgi:cell division protein FtsZ